MTGALSQLKIMMIASAVLAFPIWAIATAEEPFADFEIENSAAMAKMMAGMAIESSSDVDRDFVDLMIPHHQGAIEMAEAELRHGHNERLRRIAQEIIVDQQQEIEAMKLSLGDSLSASTPVPTQSSPASLTSSKTPTPAKPELLP